LPPCRVARFSRINRACASIALTENGASLSIKLTSTLNLLFTVELTNSELLISTRSIVKCPVKLL
jgi:hypothetical protein